LSVCKREVRKEEKKEAASPVSFAANELI